MLLLLQEVKYFNKLAVFSALLLLLLLGSIKVCTCHLPDRNTIRSNS